MARLDDLLGIDGVMAVGEFTADGTLVDYVSNMNMPPEMAAMSAQFCAVANVLRTGGGKMFFGSWQLVSV